MEKLFFLFFTFAFLLLPLTYSQPVTQEWVRRYGDTLPETINSSSIKNDNMGNIYILIRKNNNFGYVKYDHNGNLLTVASHWPGGYEYGGGRYFDVTPTGDVYISGRVNIGLYEWIYTTKFNTSGIFQWGKSYNIDNGDAASDINVDNAGNVIVSGAAAIGSNNYALIIKYNSNGDTLWTRYFNNGQGYGIVNKITLDDSNNVYATGNISVPGNCLIPKYNSMGTMQWFTTFSNNPPHSNGGRGIQLDLARNLYVIGTESVPFSGLNDYLLKINNEGEILWNRIFTGIVSGQGRNDGIPLGPVVSSTGNSIYYLTRSDNGTGGGGYAIVTLKYNSNGDSQWVKVYNGGGIPATVNFPGDIKLDKNDDIYICGSGYFQTTGSDFVTIKYTPTGFQHWIAIYSGIITNGSDGASNLMIDTNMYVYVTGSSRKVTNNEYSAVTIKYNQPVGITVQNNKYPQKYVLLQNYPNPFNSITIITYELTKTSEIKLQLFNISGQIIREITNSKQEAGTHSVLLSMLNFSTGVYFYRLKAGTFTDTKKMILVK